MKKGIVLYLDSIAAIMGISEESICDMNMWELGEVFNGIIEYAVLDQEMFLSLQDAIDKGYLHAEPCSERARALYRVMMQMVDNSENVYQQRVRRNKEIIRHTDDIRGLV